MVYSRMWTGVAGLAAAIAVLTATGPVSADEERATEILDAMAEHYATLENLSYEMRVYSLQKAGPQEEEVDLRVGVKLQKPNKVALDVRDATTQDEPAIRLRSDGEKLYAYQAAPNRYTTQDAPPDMESIARLQSVVQATQGMIELAVSPMMDNPVGELLDQASAVRYVEDRTFENQEHHVIRLETEQQVAFDMYVTTGDQPRMRQVVVDFSEIVAAAQQFGQELEAEAYFRFNDWQANEGIEQQAFEFTPPPDAEPVTSLRPPHPIEQTRAPAFQLDRFGGGHQALGDHIGRDVVVLDFWATWCLPCVDAMPLIMDVARRYADRNVAVYAVNVQEDEQAIAAFMREHELPIENVLLDRDGRVAQSYAMRGIPHTVVIDQDGVIQRVHPGFSPDLDQLLSAEIDALLEN